MKKVTKRLTSTHFLERYRRILADNGLIHLKTDSNFLFTYTDLMVKENQLPVEFRTDDLYHTLAANENAEVANILGIRTYYEQQWIDRGLTIKYLKFRLPQTGVLVEPDVEIEMDDYRPTIDTSVRNSTKPNNLIFFIFTRNLMLKHIVMWRYKDGVDGKTALEHSAWMKENLEALVGVVPELHSLEYGIDVLRTPSSYDAYSP